LPIDDHASWAEYKKAIDLTLSQQNLAMKKLETPYYLIDESRLMANLKVIEHVRESSGAKCVLALKCFSTWGVFDLMAKSMDGTTSSSLYEARLGKEKFGKEVHAYSVAYSAKEIKEVVKVADKVIFNSLSQLKRYHAEVMGLKVGIRINPGVSYSHFDLADPARKFSRLGEKELEPLMEVESMLSGAMFHFNCENEDFADLSAKMDLIGEKFGPLLKNLEWVSFGGGIFFTKPDYAVDKFCAKLKAFSKKFKVQIYLEPGEAAITNSAELVTIVDASVEAHMLDLLIYSLSAKVSAPTVGKHESIIAGRTCLAGDVFGTYKLEKALEVGDEVRFDDAAGYTMVKKNWFNGVAMPSIAVRRSDGKVELVRKFKYKNFRDSLS
jgi:carboxynorspermidine decarboxylase